MVFIVYRSYELANKLRLSLNNKALWSERPVRLPGSHRHYHENPLASPWSFPFAKSSQYLLSYKDWSDLSEQSLAN
jgi:hypothetical protein